MVYWAVFFYRFKKGLLFTCLLFCVFFNMEKKRMFKYKWERFIWEDEEKSRV